MMWNRRKTYSGKKLSFLVTAWILLITSCLSYQGTAFAAAETDGWQQWEAVIDEADLFSDMEENNIYASALKIGNEIGAQLVVLTIDRDTKKSAMSYAKSYLKENGYGYDENRESILFLIDMHQREYVVFEYNKKSSGYLLTDDEGDLILDALESSMRNGRYADAANLFLQKCMTYSMVTIGTNKRTPEEKRLYTSLGIGFVLGGIITAVALLCRNRDAKTSAGVYLKHNQIRLISHADVFTHTTTTKTKIESSSSSSKGGGRSFSGGSSGGGHGGSRSF